MKKRPLIFVRGKRRDARVPDLYYSQPKKEIRLRHMKKQNPTRTVHYPVLHFEKEAAPVIVLKFLPSSLLLVASFQEAAFPF